LMGLLEQAPGEAVEGHIMAGLERLQNIDRVSQWLANVHSCLVEWRDHLPPAAGDTPWRDGMLQRCVMEEERAVIRSVLEE
ncbi:MAG: hypothetical protein D6682_07210, partial [Zetaproteobacteria bacterium]